MKRKVYTIKGHTFSFVPSDLNEYPYRVVVDSFLARGGWLKWEYEPNYAAASYFYHKLVRGEDQPELLEKALKKEKAPALHTLAGFQKWLRDHEWEEVGMVGGGGLGYDTPIYRYLKETREDWKRREGFLIKGVHENRPRWMFRIDAFFRAQDLKREVMGFQVLNLMHEQKWDTKQYDTF